MAKRERPFPRVAKSTVVFDTDPMSERGKRARMSQSAFRHVGKLMGEHPDIKMSAVLLYTPPGPRDVQEGHDKMQLALLHGEDEISLGETILALELMISSLEDTRAELLKDPEKYGAVRVLRQ